jgi:hypothetical protein
MLKRQTGGGNWSITEWNKSKAGFRRGTRFCYKKNVIFSMAISRIECVLSAGFGLPHHEPPHQKPIREFGFWRVVE